MRFLSISWEASTRTSESLPTQRPVQWCNQLLRPPSFVALLRFQKKTSNTNTTIYIYIWPYIYIRYFSSIFFQCELGNHHHHKVGSGSSYDQRPITTLTYRVEITPDTNYKAIYWGYLQLHLKRQLQGLTTSTGPLFFRAQGLRNSGSCDYRSPRQ